MHSKVQNNNSKIKEYYPLFTIIGLISFVTIVLATKALFINQFSWSNVMSNFMAGFFLVFSGFKLLDLKGFAEGYSMYDLLAQKVKVYGYIYPFIELVLGLLYVIHYDSPLVNGITIIIMGFSGIGVLIKLMRHEQFHCACLGTLLKVPLTKITLIEDFGMVIMALLMLVLR